MTWPNPRTRYFLDLFQRLTGTDVEVDLGAPWHRAGSVYGDPRLQPQRLGQQAFKGVVPDAYQHRCAITRAKVRPVLQAAHILPLPSDGEPQRRPVVPADGEPPAA
jgi:putative restriction endonuclease